MDKDKLIDMLIAKNDSLEKLINQIDPTIEQHRKKSEKLMDDLRTQEKTHGGARHSGRTLA